jgi:hypothetical protein
MTSTPTAADVRPNCCVFSDRSAASTAHTRYSVPTQLVLSNHSFSVSVRPRLRYTICISATVLATR